MVYFFSSFTTATNNESITIVECVWMMAGLSSLTRHEPHWLVSEAEWG